jgi:hypothetical protein
VLPDIGASTEPSERNIDIIKDRILLLCTETLPYVSTSLSHLVVFLLQTYIDIKGYTIHIKGSTTDIKGSTIDIKGSTINIKGSTIDIKGSTIELITAFYCHQWRSGPIAVNTEILKSFASRRLP